MRFCVLFVKGGGNGKGRMRKEIGTMFRVIWNLDELSANQLHIT